MIGQILAQYRIISKLGEGGMGVVYRAEDLRLGRHVALKFLPEDLVSDARALERFEREARAASALNHPHICTIHQIEDHAGRPFIVMELVEGRTLRERLAGKPLRVSELVEMSLQIADALAAAHGKNIAHRDIKSSNLMLTSAGQVKVMDFGLAKEIAKAQKPGRAADTTETLTIADGLTRPGMAVGTLAYMSPEQARGEPVDTRADLFSLGVVMYEMATGMLPFRGPTPPVVFEAILNKTPAAPHEVNPDMPADLDRVVMKLLEKDRDFRYQSAADLHTDLRRIQRDGESAKVPTTTNSWTRRFWLPAVALMAMIFVALAAWKLEWLSGRKEEPVADLNPRQLTANPPGDFVAQNAISPDGKYLAYTDLAGIHLRAVDGGETQQLPVPENMCFR